MARNYLIAIGGTGSRCGEAVVYLAAAGLFREAIHILIIDPDQNNGNSVKTRQLVVNYHALHLAQQPKQARLKSGWGFGGAKLPEPQLFQASINRHASGGNAQHSIFWHNPNPAQRRFGEVIEYQGQSDEFKDFLNLFYEPSDLEMVLDVGYRGRTNVGAVALKQDLEGTSDIAEGGLLELLANLNIDLQNEETKVFVMGSVFGGTGAAGLPTIPALIDRLPDEVVSNDNRKRLRYGCAMMTPYFSFPKGNSSNTGPGTDSARHAVATQAALLHYAHVPPGYQHVYFIGAPAKPQTNTTNVVGGQNQTNDPHYAELIAALSAFEFFSQGKIRPDVNELHFADTQQNNQDLGVRWDTLPVHPGSTIRRQEIKERLVIFTTFAYFYKNFLYQRFMNNHAYKDTTWYRNNFGQLTLDDQGLLLHHLYEFSVSYLRWLHQIGDTGRHANPRLFNWNGLLVEDLELCGQFVGNLVDDTAGSAKYMSDGYHRILERLDAIRLKQPETESATGLFVYLLQHAVAEFCRDNYSWQALRASQ